VYIIQFGHNDQKESAGISISDYKKNLAAFAREVKSAGGTPILVTPLTRRTFKGSKVVENLSEQRTATIAAATGGGYSYIDLNMASTKYINEIGQSKAMQYNLADKDYTHLNTRGSVLFGRMVANLLVDKFPDLERSLHNALTSPN
jgi:lysophospholipase L1-like esterase